MQKRGVKDYVKKNLFWVIMISIACFIALGFYIFSYSVGSADLENKVKKSVYKKRLKKEKKFEKFVVSCFGERVIVGCKSLKGSGHCTKDFKKAIKRTCIGLGLLGADPLDSVLIDIRFFDAYVKQIVKTTGYSPAFIKLNKQVGGYEASIIYIPKHRMKSKDDRDAIFIHELTHALASKHNRRTSRVVGEFFAVYSQIKFFDYKYHLVCNGKGWNQQVLRNYKGDYVYPDSLEKKLVQIVSSCRYGQLEYLTRLLDKQAPLLYERLWHKLKTDLSGRIDNKKLKEWIKGIDKNAWKIASKFYILQEINRKPHIASINNGEELCFFVYESISADEEDFFNNVRLHVDWWRGKTRLRFYSGMTTNYICIDAKDVQSKDVFFIRTTVKGKNLNKKFIFP